MLKDRYVPMGISHPPYCTYAKFQLQKLYYRRYNLMKQESPAVADKPARRLQKVCTVYVRAVGL